MHSLSSISSYQDGDEDVLLDALPGSLDSLDEESVIDLKEGVSALRELNLSGNVSNEEMIRRTKLLVSFLEFQAADDDDDDHTAELTAWQRILNCFVSCYKGILPTQCDES